MGSQRRHAILRKESLPGVLGEGLPGVSEEGLSFSKRKACLRSQGRLAWGLRGKLGILRKEGLRGIKCRGQHCAT